MCVYMLLPVATFKLCIVARNGVEFRFHWSYIVCQTEIPAKTNRFMFTIRLNFAPKRAEMKRIKKLNENANKKTTSVREFDTHQAHFDFLISVFSVPRSRTRNKLEFGANISPCSVETARFVSRLIEIETESTYHT